MTGESLLTYHSKIHFVIVVLDGLLARVRSSSASPRMHVTYRLCSNS